MNHLSSPIAPAPMPVPSRSCARIRADGALAALGGALVLCASCANTAKTEPITDSVPGVPALMHNTAPAGANIQANPRAISPGKAAAGTAAAGTAAAGGAARLPIALWSRARVIRKVPVAARDKVFALTFDDGPWPGSTRRVLRILKQKNVQATFFMVGHEVSRRPEIAREVSAAGMVVGNHSWDHPSRPRDAVAQITRTDAVIERAIGYRPLLFRPPYGLLKNGMARQAMKEGDPIMLWSADCADWKKPGAAHIAMMIVGQASPGGIALMHDGGGDRSQTVAALPLIIDRLRARGYRLVTVPQLLALRHLPPPHAITASGRATAASHKNAAARRNKSHKGAAPSHARREA